TMRQMSRHSGRSNADRVSTLLIGLVTNQHFFSTGTRVTVVIIQDGELHDHKLTVICWTDHSENLLPRPEIREVIIFIVIILILVVIIIIICIIVILVAVIVIVCVLRFI